MNLKNISDLSGERMLVSYDLPDKKQRLITQGIKRLQPVGCVPLARSLSRSLVRRALLSSIL
jgi:hypothetical protein